MIRNVLLGLVVSLSLVPGFVFGAQISPVSITTEPESPRPGQELTLTASLFDENPLAVEFVWTKDGEIFAEGPGVQRAITQAPAVGKQVTIAVTILKNGAIIGSDELRLAPASVTLEWEAQTNTPPLYKGRPLMSPHAFMSAYAVSEFVGGTGARISENDILYTWRVNGSVVTRASGYGRNSAIFESPFYDSPFTVEVRAISRDGTLSASQLETIQPVRPSAVVYPTSPLRGTELWSPVITAYPFQSDEVSFIAYPLFTSRSGPLQTVWELDGVPLESVGADPRVSVFRKTGPGTGSFRVGVSVSSENNFLEQIRRGFLLEL